ncbi:MAG TPA: cysteine hydrolase family protein, partial [Syntrophales bacterium]
MTRALLLVDIQNDYFTGGAMQLVGMEAAAGKANAVLQGFRERAEPVFHIRHLSKRVGATFFIPDTPGAEIHPAVKPLATETVITKYFPNSFRGTNLLDLLKKEGIEQLVICGAMSQMCIDATTRAAFDLGFKCTVIEDACATRNLTFKGEVVPAWAVHGAFMAALQGIY